jgi:hypothetical protein
MLKGNSYSKMMDVNCEHQSAAILRKGAVMNKVSIIKNLAMLAFLLAGIIALPATRADESNQAIQVTFKHPVQIPGHVLPAGTYWFVLPKDASQHNEVRILNSDQTIVYANLITIPAQRLQPTDHTAITFAERGSGQAQAIVTWFYPGQLDGHEFLYPKQVAQELAKDKRDTVVAAD